MKFVYKDLLKSYKNVVCVDGAFNAKLQVSHWHGNESPIELKADTTTEMAFKLIEYPDKNKFLNGIEVVSNNHFDADGVLSAYVILFPQTALEMKKALVNIARTGDFAEFTDEDSLKAVAVLESFQNPDNKKYKTLMQDNYPQAMQKIYEDCFELIPRLVKSIDKFEESWKNDFDFFEKSEKSFEIKESVFSNYGDCKLSVLESKFPLHVVSKYKNSEHDILLSVEKHDESNKYQLEYKYHTWFDTTREKTLERKNLEPLSQKLNQIELNSEGKWRVIGTNPLYDWNYGLTFADENFNQKFSSLKIYEVENILFDYFNQF